MSRHTLVMLSGLSVCLIVYCAGGLFDYGNADAWQYMFEYLSAAVQEYHLDVLRIDFNIDPGQIWAASDAGALRWLAALLVYDFP